MKSDVMRRVEMSEKCHDSHGRWRSKTIAFRISPEDDETINQLVCLCGLTKQDYISANMMRHQITVYPNPRVQKALKAYFLDVVEQLQRIGNSGELTDEFLFVLRFALCIYAGLGDVGNDDRGHRKVALN